MSSRFGFASTPISGVAVIERKRLSDSRGYFERMFCIEELAEGGWTEPVLQINHTFTAAKGAVRGLHYQNPPHCEMKLVICMRGSIVDVAVDLRKGSASLLKWHAEVLSSDNGKALLIPEGCAHGYQCLTDNVELLYLHSAAYAAHAEGGVHPMDPRIGIEWPLAVAEMSTKDSSRALLTEHFSGISL
jgi:dTDP-4-dehydrorhamnose 3,5-epimerase